MISLFTYCLIAIMFACFMIFSLFYGDFGGDFDVEADVDGDIGDSYTGSGWSGWISMKVMAAFGTAFGASGAIVQAHASIASFALPVAIFSGLIIAFLVKKLVDFLKKQEGDSVYNRNSLLGLEGTMLLGVTGNDIGEAQFVYESQLASFPARSKGGEEIKNGDKIIVVSVSSILTVEKVQ
jgi:hypothetical protein